MELLRKVQKQMLLQVGRCCRDWQAGGVEAGMICCRKRVAGRVLEPCPPQFFCCESQLQDHAALHPGPFPVIAPTVVIPASTPAKRSPTAILSPSARSRASHGIDGSSGECMVLNETVPPYRFLRQRVTLRGRWCRSATHVFYYAMYDSVFCVVPCRALPGHWTDAPRPMEWQCAKVAAVAGLGVVLLGWAAWPT